MTYLDPSHPQARNEAIRWIVRVAFLAGLIAFGWYALTVGADPNGAPVIVPEPAMR